MPDLAAALRAERARAIELLTVPQSAARLKVHPSTMRRIVAEGRIDVVHPSPGTVRIRADVLDAYITSCNVPAVNPIRGRR